MSTHSDKEFSIKQINVAVHAESETPTRIRVRSSKFEMIIDEPESMGGTDMGPSPVQVLLMALAGCLHVTGHEVARQKGMKLNGMRIEINGTMNPCKFLGLSTHERAGFQTIDVTIHANFENETPEAIEAWLKETEERCPVTDNIENSTKIQVIATEEKNNNTFV